MRERNKQFIRLGAVAGLLISSVLAFAVTVSSTRQAVAAGERDCDPTAVIYCGALTADELNTEFNAGGTKRRYTDLSTIFLAFGISSKQIVGLRTNVAHGQVRGDNTVWLNGKQIGSGAITAGRVRTANSVAIPNTGAFKRPPSDSFASTSTVIDAFIGLDSSGRPLWAILKSCGNPVSFTPVTQPTPPPPAPAPQPTPPPPAPQPTPPPPAPQPQPKPRVIITKMVKDGAHDFSNSATVANGSTVTYQIKISNVGTGTESNLRVSDVMPAGVTYVPGSTTLSNTLDPSSDTLTTTGISISTLSVNKSLTITYRAVVSVATDRCGSHQRINTSKVTGDNTPGSSASSVIYVPVRCAVLTAATPPPAPTPVPTPTPTPAPVSYCPIAGKEGLPADSAECILPDTGGVEPLLGLFVGTSGLASLGYYGVLLRRRPL
jgi:uncharacterized repeat protein (TIGR01451 family)